MATPVTIAKDWTLPAIVPHSALFVPQVVYVPMHAHAEPPVPIDWVAGAGSHQLTSSVFHQGATIAQDSHDCGKGIPHVCWPINNAFLPLFIYFSKRKASFRAPRVCA